MRFILDFGMQLYVVNVLHFLVEKGLLLDRIDGLQAGKSKQTKPSNAKVCVKDIYSISSPIRNASFLGVLALFSG